ncbi:FIP1[V]-like protein isoform X2 [Rhododendron vialii]|uniref:FIP1[V]-like protein isoform X2 n=1 Tax=Rhododendron vialii TaxID=182163 RepID=UPI00265FB328|nr:FIP1[V]-like protein isoform X2 [Rhododendron vialii]
MEDDDEFGDLYTDVLRQFQPSPVSSPPPVPPKSPIDLNLLTQNDDVFPLGAAPNPNPNPKPNLNFTLSHHTQTLASNSPPDSNRNSNQEAVRDEGLADRASSESRVLERGGKDDFLVVEKNEGLIDKEENFDRFDIEEAEEEEPVIPGVSDRRGEGNDDWVSESDDDDLKIVLNESNHDGMVMEGLGDEDDDDDDPLVIVADSDPGLIPMEEREWAEDATTRGADGERKEVGEGAKANGGAVVAPKIGFNSSFTYQPFHSQFKYVRPGTAPMPGSVPVGLVGAPGQVRPPVNMGPVTGFGRGDWRPTGIRNTFPMQKNLHPGSGMNVWGNNTAGRGFGSGLDFTLPSHKTIFEVDINSFEEKPWRLPGLDMSDFFNFGLNEETWKDYCKQLEQLRVETTMQSKICVYESGRTEQEYDPDLPPELAAAAGVRGTSENANIAKLDGGQIDIAKGSQDVRPPLPIGRAIQVETSSVERLPSTDTRPLRIRDSDVIIEIVLQGSTDDASLPGNDVTEQPENEPLRESFRGGQETNGDIIEQQSGGRKREIVGRRAPFMNSIHDNMIEGESLLPHRPDSRERSSSNPGRNVGTLREERQAKGGARDRSPIMTHSSSTLDKGVLRTQKEDSVESSGGKQSNQFSSPATVGSDEEPDVEHRDGLHGSSVMSDGGEMALDRTTFTDTHISENQLPSVKKQKLSSRVRQSPDQEIGNEGDIKAARSRENSKARSDSSRDYHKFPDSIDEEVVQRGRSTQMGNLKRPHGEDEQSVRRKRREVEKHRMVEKGWEDSHSRRDLDPHLARHSHMKTEGIDRRKERENSEGVWQQRDDDPHGRRARAEETRNKVRERERMDKDEHLQLRKQLDYGNSRGYHDRDVGSRPRERDDNLKSQYENMNNHYTKRRKEEDYSRRDGEKEEILHSHRENPSQRKRDRDDALDPRKRDDQVRTREDNYNSVRYKEDDWIHRDRDQMHRTKQSHEESLLKREREERREGVRKTGRAAEEKLWVPHGRVKDEYKGTSARDYQFKETSRHNEQLTRRVEDGSLSQHRGHDDFHSTRGSQHNEDERRSRQEREGTRRDLVGGGSDNNRVHEKKRKANMRSKDSKGGDGNSVGPSTISQEDQSGHMNERVRYNSRNTNMPLLR